MALARAWAGAWARARARAWAGAWARARAGAGARRRIDRVDLLMHYDMSEEEGIIVWSDCKVGQCVLIECPQRWVLGVVTERTQATVRLMPALCGHDLGDYGMFLDGKVSESTELTPLPRGIEVSLVTADSVQPYPLEFFERINKRTHQPQRERQG